MAADLIESVVASASGYETEVLVLVDEALAPSERPDRIDGRPLSWLVAGRPIDFGSKRRVAFAVAEDRGVDAIAVLDGGGRHDPEHLPVLMTALEAEDADLVIASRRARLRGRVVTGLQNLLLGSRLRDSQSGYRVYRRRALEAVPYRLNRPGRHFDAEILIQLQLVGARVVEAKVPRFRETSGFGDGIIRASEVLRAALAARLQRHGILYRRNLDLDPEGVAHYEAKLGYPSSHQLAVDLTPSGSRVLDLGCAGGHVGRALKAERQCLVHGLDAADLDPESLGLDAFIRHDLDEPDFPVELEPFDTVLFLDVIEHLKRPEDFVAALYLKAGEHPDLRLIVTSANVAFAPVRLMLLAGQMNYGKRGILDRTHTRLFTIRSLERLFEEGGFVLERRLGIPAPYPLVFGHGRLARALLALNQLAIELAPSVFAYQMLLVLRPLPSIDWWLRQQGGPESQD